MVLTFSKVAVMFYGVNITATFTNIDTISKPVFLQAFLTVHQPFPEEVSITIHVKGLDNTRNVGYKERLIIFQLSSDQEGRKPVAIIASSRYFYVYPAEPGTTFCRFSPFPEQSKDYINSQFNFTSTLICYDLTVLNLSKRSTLLRVYI